MQLRTYIVMQSVNDDDALITTYCRVEAFVCDTHIAHVDIAIKHGFSMLCAALIKVSTLK